MLDLDMSPYAAFVWPAWGISVLVLAAIVVRALAASRRWKAELARLDADRPQTTQDVSGQPASPQAAQGATGSQG
jgi:heme exporter protein D